MIQVLRGVEPVRGSLWQREVRERKSMAGRIRGARPRRRDVDMTSAIGVPRRRRLSFRLDGAHRVWLRRAEP
jgi:hypothetical protein